MCLIEMVEEKGLARLVARDATTITIEILGATEVYQIVKVNEFTSERKMMSIVVRNTETQKQQVYAKGASDSMSTHLASQLLDG